MNGFVTIRLPVLAASGREEIAVEAAVPAAAEQAPSDEVLLANVCAGDQEALAWLFRRYARTVRGVAYRVLRDSSEADDLLQDVFLLVHRLCKNFDPAKGSARVWILQMTYRRALSRRRYLSTRHFYNRVDLGSLGDSLSATAASSQLPDEIIDRLTGQELLQDIFEELSPDQQQTLRMFFFEGYSLSEIASRLGQTTGNVSHHYYRGLEKLRRRIFGGKLQSK